MFSHHITGRNHLLNVTDYQFRYLICHFIFFSCWLIEIFIQSWSQSSSSWKLFDTYIFTKQRLISSHFIYLSKASQTETCGSIILVLKLLYLLLLQLFWFKFDPPLHWLPVSSMPSSLIVDLLPSTNLSMDRSRNRFLEGRIHRGLAGVAEFVDKLLSLGFGAVGVVLSGDSMWCSINADNWEMTFCNGAEFRNAGTYF